MKNNITEHMSCSSIQSGGQFHATALQHMLQEKQRKARHTSVTVNIVSAGVEVCKMKSAALHFESMLSFLAFCQADIGNIGHSRYAVIQSVFRYSCNFMERESFISKLKTKIDVSFQKAISTHHESSLYILAATNIRFPFNASAEHWTASALFCCYR